MKCHSSWNITMMKYAWLIIMLKVQLFSSDMEAIAACVLQLISNEDDDDESIVHEVY